MPPKWWNSTLMRAMRHETVEHTPVWLMRQAGRYMEEYRAIRQSTPFLSLCKQPALCAEVMLTAVERLGVDAAILFSDLLLILDAMGMQLEYSAGDGPILHNPIRTSADIDGLTELESIAPMEYVLEAVRQTRAGLPENIPLIGFAGAPFTLAAYAIEGGSNRDYRRTKTLMLMDTGAWDALMGRLSRSITLLLNAQIDAGAQAVQLFDSWAGCLSVDEYRSFVLPHTRSIIEALKPETPVIHFATGNPALLPLLSEAFGKRKQYPVVGVDWRPRLDDAWRIIGHDMGIQGNLDPVVLLTDPTEIRRQVREILHQAGRLPGHIFNLGHGVLPQTPVENVIALVQAVHEFSSR